MKLTLNLASRTYINRRVLYTAYAGLLGALALIFVLNSTYFLRLHKHNQQIEGHLKELAIELGKMAGSETGELEPSAIQQLAEEAAFANEILEKDSFRWTALLDNLEKVMIKGISITSIQPDYTRGELRISAVAQGVEHLRNFLDKILSSPDFSDAYLLSQSKTVLKDQYGEDRDAVSFSVILKGAF